MFLKNITLLHYKNFTQARFDLDARINCFVGNNGKGKTNVLDAVYHLAVGRSYFNPLAVQNIQHGADFFVLEGEFDKSGRTESIVCSLKKGQKKILRRNGKPYQKFSEHLGLIPIVIISPADRDLISAGSDLRRSFIDSVISQLDATYLHELIQYQKVLTQRNALLKYFAANRIFERETLEIYNEQLDVFSRPIFEKRQAFLTEFTPIFESYFADVSAGAETPGLRYESQLFQNNLLSLLDEHLVKDRALQYSSAGIHKDDLLFEIDGHPIKKFGSQGQQKSFLIALKLAQFEFLRKRSGEKPILIFDDIFDKLDQDRVMRIIGLVNREDFGQLFISDTHPERTEAVVKSTQQSYKMFHL